MSDRVRVAHGLLAATVALTAAVTLRGVGASPGWTMILLFLAIAGWAGLLWAMHRWGRVGRRTVLAAAVLGGVLAIVTAPVGSTDVRSYAMYGRIVSAHHASPYTSVPADYPDDPWLPRMAAFWQHTGSVYGPVFTGVSAGIMAFAGVSELKARLCFQLLELAAFLGAIVIVDRRTRGDPAALAFVGLNPVVVANVLNGGHNDLLVGLGVLAAVVLVQRDRRSTPAHDDRRAAAAGVVLALALLVKVVAVLALGALVLWLLRAGARRGAAVLTTSAVVTTVAGYLLAGGRAALTPLLDASSRAVLPSPWGYPRRWISERLASEGVGDAAAVANRTTGRLALLTIAVLAGLLLLAHLRDRDPVLPVAGALLAYLVAGAYVMAWYPAWVLLVVALRWRSRLALVAAADAALLLLAFVERPNHLHGATLTVERFLHDTFVPLVQVGVVVALAAGAVVELTARRRSAAGDRELARHPPAR